MASNGDSNDQAAASSSSSEQQSLAKPKSTSQRANSDQLCGTNSSCYSRTYDAHTTDDSDNEGSHHDTKSSKRSLLKTRNKYSSSHIRSHNHHHHHHHNKETGLAYLANPQAMLNNSPANEFADDTVSRKKADGRKYDDSKNDDYEISDEKVSQRVLASRRQSSPTSFSPSTSNHIRQGILKQTSRESSTSNLDSSVYTALEPDSGLEAHEDTTPTTSTADGDSNASANRYSRANSEIDSRTASKQSKTRLISNTLEFHQVSL